MVSARAAPNRAFSSGAMTSSHAASTSDSCARTEYADAGRARRSAPMSRKTAACPERSRGTLQRRVVEGCERVSRKQSRTLGEVLCNHDAARGFELGVTRKPEEPAA